MSKIKLTLPDSCCTGKQVSFVSPCTSENVEALIIEDKEYTLVDPNNQSLCNLKGLWCEGAIVSVILDCKNMRAYVQNLGAYATSASEMKQELILCKTFEDLNIASADYATDSNGNYTGDAMSAYRKLSIPLEGSYSDILILMYTSPLSNDPSDFRDMKLSMLGEYGGITNLSIEAIIAKSGDRFTRIHNYKDKGMWWCEWIGPASDRGSALRPTFSQSGYGYSNERVDAELGIVDPLHLGVYEGISSLTIQMTIPGWGGARHNPNGRIVVYGVNNQKPADITYYSVSSDLTTDSIKYAHHSYAGQTVYVDIIDTTKTYKVVDLSGNTIKSTTSTESYQYSGNAFKQLKFTMPAKDVIITISDAPSDPDEPVEEVNCWKYPAQILNEYHYYVEVEPTGATYWEKYNGAVYNIDAIHFYGDYGYDTDSDPVEDYAFNLDSGAIGYAIFSQDSIWEIVDFEEAESGRGYQFKEVARCQQYTEYSCTYDESEVLDSMYLDEGEINDIDSQSFWQTAETDHVDMNETIYYVQDHEDGSYYAYKVLTIK